MKNHFIFQVADIFQIKGRGVVATGRITSGSVSIGDDCFIQYSDGSRRKSSVKAIEKFRRVVERASLGDNVGLLLNDISREEVIGAEYIVSSADPTNIKNQQIYYDGNTDPYVVEKENRGTLIDGKPISEQKDDNHGVTIFDKIFKRKR